MRAEHFNRILARVKGQRRREAGQRGGAALAGAGRIRGRELRPLRPQPAPLRALHLADPPLRRPGRASRADPRAEASAPTACPTARTTRALGEIAAQISAAERRAMKAERETNDRLIAHFLADRIGATLRGPHPRRHPRRPVRQARRHRRRRLRPGAHHRRRVFPLRGGPPRAGRQPHRRDLPARRPRHREAGRGGAGRRRAAIRAVVRRPRLRKRPPRAPAPRGAQAAARAPSAGSMVKRRR